jgi:hypothetical protein
LHRAYQTEIGSLNISGNIRNLHAAAAALNHNTQITERVGAAVTWIVTQETPVSDNGRVISHFY